MRHLSRIFALVAPLLIMSLAPVAVFAKTVAAAATVEAVQAPAWRDRNGLSVPLAPGMELKSGDVLRTGTGARAYLQLAEGSRVKLGESARFTLHSRSLQPQRSFQGFLDVLAGAFRFTTGKLRVSRRHNVAIRVGTATIGIRGTDLWGRTGPDGDLVALLEGRIEISRGGQVTALTQPMSYFDAPRSKAAEVKRLDPEVFKRLARETEIEAGDGALRRSGTWRLLAAVTDSQEAALEVYDQIRAAGFAVRIEPKSDEPNGWKYRLLLGNFSGAEEAEVAAARLTAATGLKPSVLR